jgi:hypothetical protein
MMEGPCAESGEKHEPASDVCHRSVDSLKVLDPNVWTRRALQGKIVRLESVVSHQCIRPRIGADAPGHHGNPRTPELITGHASKGYLGSSVLGCAGKDHLSIYSLLSQNLGGKVEGLHRVSRCCERLIGDCSRRQLRRLIHRPDLKVTTTVENAPGDAGDFVGERNRQLKAIEPPGCSLDP